MNKNMTKNNSLNNKKSGFTLLETMVAIMLFILAISALLALVSDSVTSATYNKNEIVATYLAQEGIDYVRNIRDEMVHVNPSSTPWADFVTSVTSSIPPSSDCDGVNGCYLDYLKAPSLGSSFTPTDYIVPIYNGSQTKPFTRKITVQSLTDVILVKVEITWLNGNTTRTKVLTTSLYNWAL